MNQNQEDNKSKSTSELDALKAALANKDQELKDFQTLYQKTEGEKEEIRQVLKNEEEKSLLRKHGFASEELENIRLLCQGEITESKLQEIKNKAFQKQTNAFTSLLHDSNKIKDNQNLPWEDKIQYMKDHPKGKVR